jgi:hypothetical protein
LIACGCSLSTRRDNFELLVDRQSKMTIKKLAVQSLPVRAIDIE